FEDVEPSVSTDVTVGGTHRSVPTRTPTSTYPLTNSLPLSGLSCPPPTSGVGPGRAGTTAPGSSAASKTSSSVRAPTPAGSPPTVLLVRRPTGSAGTSLPRSPWGSPTPGWGTLRGLCCVPTLSHGVRPGWWWGLGPGAPPAPCSLPGGGWWGLVPAPTPRWVVWGFCLTGVGCCGPVRT